MQHGFAGMVMASQPGMLLRAAHDSDPHLNFCRVPSRAPNMRLLRFLTAGLSSMSSRGRFEMPGASSSSCMHSAHGLCANIAWWAFICWTLPRLHRVQGKSVRCFPTQMCPALPVAIHRQITAQPGWALQAHLPLPISHNDRGREHTLPLGREGCRRRRPRRHAAFCSSVPSARAVPMVVLHRPTAVIVPVPGIHPAHHPTAVISATSPLLKWNCHHA